MSVCECVCVWLTLAWFPALVVAAVQLLNKLVEDCSQTHINKHYSYNKLDIALL